MAFLGGRGTFGRKKPVSYQELKRMDWNTPDADGVTRVFSRELWDDPTVGKLLRDVGMSPDDPGNIRKTMDDYRAEFALAKARLDAEVEAASADLRRRHGHAQLGPFLLIDGPIWDGRHGAFLFGQLALCPYDEWNVMLLGTDLETIKRCPVLPHVGRDQALLTAMEKKVGELHARYEHGLELFGLTATGQAGGIDRAQWDEVTVAIKADLMAYVANARRVMTERLVEFAADVRSGKIRI